MKVLLFFNNIKLLLSLISQIVSSWMFDFYKLINKKAREENV